MTGRPIIVINDNLAHGQLNTTCLVSHVVVRGNLFVAAVRSHNWHMVAQKGWQLHRGIPVLAALESTFSRTDSSGPKADQRHDRGARVGQRKDEEMSLLRRADPGRSQEVPFLWAGRLADQGRDPRQTALGLLDELKGHILRPMPDEPASQGGSARMCPACLH